MPWRFDRLFKLEITEALTALGLNYDDEFEVYLDITDVENNKLPENTFSHDTILHEESQGGSAHHDSKVEASCRKVISRQMTRHEKGQGGSSEGRL